MYGSSEILFTGRMKTSQKMGKTEGKTGHSWFACFKKAWSTHDPTDISAVSCELECRMWEKFLQFVSGPLHDHLSVCVVTTVTTVTGDRWCWPATNISPSPAPGCGPGQIPTPSNSALTLSSPSPHTTGENQNHVHLFIQNSDITLSLPPSTLSYGPMVGDHCSCGPWASRVSCVHGPSILLHNAVAQMRLLISHIHTFYSVGWNILIISI